MQFNLVLLVVAVNVIVQTVFPLLHLVAPENHVSHYSFAQRALLQLILKFHEDMAGVLP